MSSTRTIKSAPISASRVLSALGRIGYHPVSALLDIVDNSVSANADNINILVELERRKSQGGGRPATVVKSFAILDNGDGMDEDGLDNALALGSSKEFYPAETLSKFGLGLKSASSSLGQKLEIISRTATSETKLAVMDQNKLETEYTYELGQPDHDDVSILNSQVGENNPGTLVRITDIHEDSMPSATDIIDGLRKRAGVIFHYYLLGISPASHKIAMSLTQRVGGGDETAQIEPFDPLFTEEADANGDLDEHDWDGLSTRWITREQPIQLDPSGSVWAILEVTQLPHPPSLGHAAIMSAAEARRKYMIGAQHYGFYIYRNGRLISWAESLAGFIPQDQNLYSFRGRFLIDSDADDVLNIDVTKSRIHLSEVAAGQIRGIIQEGKKKSSEAWSQAYRNVQRMTGDDPHSEINSQLDEIGELEERSDILDEEAAPQEERQQREKRRKQISQKYEASEEEGQKLNREAQRVQYVDQLENNQLWERAHDPTRGLIVRVNKSHRLYRDIISLEHENSPLIRSLDIVFFALARGEYSVLYKSNFNYDESEKILEEYRVQVGGELAEILRRLRD